MTAVADTQATIATIRREVCALHDHFGRGGDDVMHVLRRIGKEAPVRD